MDQALDEISFEFLLKEANGKHFHHTVVGLQKDFSLIVTGRGLVTKQL